MLLKCIVPAVSNAWSPMFTPSLKVTSPSSAPVVKAYRNAPSPKVCTFSNPDILSKFPLY